MSTVPIYTPTKDQQEFIRQLNLYLDPVATCVIHNINTCVIQYKFVGNNNNLYINSVMFELSDRFYIIIEELSQLIFQKPYTECIEFNNIKNVFWFIDNIC